MSDDCFIVISNMIYRIISLIIRLFEEAMARPADWRSTCEGGLA